MTWSLWHDSCQLCGTTADRHHARGLCVVCYERERRTDPARIETKKKADAKWRAKRDGVRS